jgi:hypothetical protein
MNTVKPESIALFCLTPGGVALANRLKLALPMTCYTSEKLLEEGFVPFDGGFALRCAMPSPNTRRWCLSARPGLPYACWPRW